MGGLLFFLRGRHQDWKLQLLCEANRVIDSHGVDSSRTSVAQPLPQILVAYFASASGLFRPVPEGTILSVFDPKRPKLNLAVS